MKTVFYPANREAEAAALGCALRGDDAAHILATVPTEYFSTAKLRALHQAVKQSLSQQDTIDPVILREVLLKTQWWDDSGDAQSEKVTMDFLSDLQDQAPPPVQVKSYIRLLQQAYRQRCILQEARKIEEQAGQRFLSDEELNSLENTLQESAFAISINQADKGCLIPVKNVISDAFVAIEARHKHAKEPYGVCTGFTKLDGYMTGMHPPELIVACGRPGTGKTSFALDIALSAVKQVPAALFSLEMSAEQIGQRLLAKKAAVNLRRVRSGDLEQHHFDSIVTAMGDLSDYPLFIDDTATLTPAQIRFRVRNLSVKSKTLIGLVIVDYLQIMSPGRKYDSREREISSISREMKQVAKDLNCPVIVLSQLNRELEKRADKRPILADLRESGAIEQDADVVIGLYQPFPYTNKDEDRGKAEAIILKQRNGPVGTIDLGWTPETTSFWNP